MSHHVYLRLRSGVRSANAPSRPRALAVAVAVLLLSACSADRIGEPAPRSALTHGVRLPETIGLGWSVSRENICEEEEVDREWRGPTRGWKNRLTKPVDVRPAARDTVFAEYQIWQFDASGQQTHRATCVLPKGDAANRFARDYFQPKDESGRAPLRIPLYSIGIGTTCYWINSQGDVDCGGEICYLQFVTIRAPATEALRAPSRAAPVDTTTLSASVDVIATWNCAGGGGLSMAGNGTVTYHLPPSGGGDGGSGGSTDPCGGGGSGDDDGNGDGSVGGNGSGGELPRGGARCVIRLS